MPHKELKLTVKIPTENAVRARDLEKALSDISTLPADDLARILELAKSPKALAGLRDNWAMLKGMFN